MNTSKNETKQSARSFPGGKTFWKHRRACSDRINECSKATKTNVEKSIFTCALLGSLLGGCSSPASSSPLNDSGMGVMDNSWISKSIQIALLSSWRSVGFHWPTLFKIVVLVGGLGKKNLLINDEVFAMDVVRSSIHTVNDWLSYEHSLTLMWWEKD